MLVEDADLAFEPPSGQFFGPSNPNLAGVAKIVAICEELGAAGGIAYLSTRRPFMLDPVLFSHLTLSVKLGEREGEERKRMWTQVRWTALSSPASLI